MLKLASPCSLSHGKLGGEREEGHKVSESEREKGRWRERKKGREWRA